MNSLIEYGKCEDGSYVYNCVVVRRKDEKEKVLLQKDENKTVTARLNGYAVIPLEEYIRLTGAAGFPAATEMLEHVPGADKQLHG